MERTGKPNIVLIVADDQRFDTIHALGNAEIRTPTLDALAERGVAFRSTYITGSITPAICVPSRSCIHTGRHALRASRGRHLNIWPDLMTMNPDATLLPQAFREAGYRTFATGKWHNDKAGFVRSFSDGGDIFFGGMSEHDKVPVYDFDPSGEYRKENRRIGGRFSTDLFTDAAVRFIRHYSENRPFFLYLAYTAPHDPRTAPAEFRALYRDEEIPLPPNFMGRHPFDNGEMNVRDELLDAFPRQPDAVRRHIADYYAMITHMDARIGDVVEALRERGELDNTIIVFTADHGLALGRHGLMGKQNLYDHSIRIPLIMAGPGLPHGRVFGELTCQTDIFPTLCDLAGVPVPESVEGKSLVPLIRGETGRVHDYVFAVYKDLQRMVTDGEWKLIRYYRPEEHNYGTDRIQLFHLKDDPWEIADLSEDPQCGEQLRRLCEALKTEQTRLQDPWGYRPVLPPKTAGGIWGNWTD